MKGSKVKIWKQDPTVDIGIRSCFIHTEVGDGPKDSEIEIKGMPVVLANSERDFLFNPAENQLEFDAVHTFAIVRQVLTIFKRALLRNGITSDFSWQWGSGQPIQVYPRAGLDANAYYARGERSLRFFYFHPQNNERLNLVYTCRSFDIVAHECGHAILDALKPGFWSSHHPETGGIHESFGDQTAIFTMLAQMDQCEAIIAESKANLHNKSFFPAIAEQFGEALYGRTTGLRNADNDLKMSDVSNQVHDISQVLTGAVYDILADIFDDYKKPDSYDHAETLFRVGKHMTSLVILSILQGPGENATYKDIAEKMIEIEPVEKWKEFIKEEFTKREILGRRVGMAKPGKPRWDKCCGTLRHSHHTRDVEETDKKNLGKK
ncbi:MAG: hypothetical protein GY940_17425 [bacterium]|nr:hypothetical protein [bacterium]